MISKQTRAKYTTTIGIECHVQLNTKTKLFAGVANDAREAAPNSLVSHICFGLPGALPVLNEKVLKLASRMAFALNTRPQLHSIFERKHYFYPDLPKGYQISQLSQPIIIGGEVEITTEKSSRHVKINRVQIEEDAGKNTHPSGKDYSLVDLNRAGTPLLEIVSEADMHSPEEARAYVRELYLLVKYSGISEADLYHGNMRFDVNVSVSPNQKLGTRTETKNLNSFKSVEKTVEYEIKRQIELLEKGHTIIQETRGWDDAKQKTISQRGKEEAHDYRYMPEPDIPPIVLTNAYIDKVQATMPKLPKAWRSRLRAVGLDQDQIEILMDAQVEANQPDYLNLLDTLPNQKGMIKAIANWMINIEVPIRREKTTSQLLNLDARKLLYRQVFALIQSNLLSSTKAKQLLTTLLIRTELPKEIEAYAKQAGLLQMSDTAQLTELINEVIKNHPEAVAQLNKGQTKIIGFLVGQVMQASKGQADPSLTQQLIKEQFRL